jgi:flagellar hook-associated protein 3 FlgL
MFRITQHAMAQTSLRGLNSNLNTINKLQQQLTSGKTISRPADDPTGTNTSMVARQDLAGINQQARNITDGKTFLDATDSALQGMLAQVHRVRDLTVQALNTGAASSSSLQNIATEVKGLRDSLIASANQVVQGRAIFAGVSSGTQAYDSTGNYVGIGVPGTATPVMPLTRQVSDVEAIRVDITGPEAFGIPGKKDLFQVVQNITDNVTDMAANGTGPAGLQGDLNDLDNVINGMLTAAADIGTRSSRLDIAQQVNASAQLSLQSKLSDTEDVDLPKTVMQLQMQQVGYQAALSVTAKTMQQTLLDFLR